MSPRRPYLTYLCYSEAWIAVISQTVSIVLMSHLIYCVYAKSWIFVLRSKLSKSLLVYLYTHVICSSTGISYHIYLVVKWHVLGNDQEPLYNPVWLYWTGLWAINYTTVVPGAVLLITLDRCLTLSLPFYYTQIVQDRVVGAGAFTITTMYAASTCVFFMELPVQVEKTIHCETFSCVNLKYLVMPQLFAKLFIATLNFFGCVYFFHALKKAEQRNIKDRVIKYTIVLEIFCDMFPAYFAYFFNFIMGESSSNYVGGLGGTLCPVDAALCSLFYSFVLLKRRNAECNSALVVKLTTFS